MMGAAAGGVGGHQHIERGAQTTFLSHVRIHACVVLYIEEEEQRG